MNGLFLFLCGSSFGVLSSAGVFTVLIAVGLVPRFAGKTHTANRVLLYEDMVVLGVLVGGLVSIFPEYLHVPAEGMVWEYLGNGLQVIIGLFSGMFVGALALAIAEMLDAVPIFARRISLRHGLSWAVLGIALGKLCGSLFYFATKM